MSSSPCQPLELHGPLLTPTYEKDCPGDIARTPGAKHEKGSEWLGGLPNLPHLVHPREAFVSIALGSKELFTSISLGILIDWDSVTDPSPSLDDRPLNIHWLQPSGAVWKEVAEMRRTCLRTYRNCWRQQQLLLLLLQSNAA